MDLNLAANLEGNARVKRQKSPHLKERALTPESSPDVGRLLVPPEDLDRVDGIRPSSSRTRAVSLLPAIEESIEEGADPPYPEVTGAPGSKHGGRRPSSKPTLTSISEERIPRMWEYPLGGRGWERTRRPGQALGAGETLPPRSRRYRGSQNTLDKSSDGEAGLVEAGDAEARDGNRSNHALGDPEDDDIVGQMIHQPDGEESTALHETSGSGSVDEARLEMDGSCEGETSLPHFSEGTKDNEDNTTRKDENSEGEMLEEASLEVQPFGVRDENRELASEKKSEEVVKKADLLKTVEGKYEIPLLSEDSGIEETNSLVIGDNQAALLVASMAKVNVFARTAVGRNVKEEPQISITEAGKNKCTMRAPPITDERMTASVEFEGEENTPQSSEVFDGQDAKDFNVFCDGARLTKESGVAESSVCETKEADSSEGGAYTLHLQRNIYDKGGKADSPRECIDQDTLKQNQEKTKRVDVLDELISGDRSVEAITQPAEDHEGLLPPEVFFPNTRCSLDESQEIDRLMHPLSVRSGTLDPSKEEFLGLDFVGEDKQDCLVLEKNAAEDKPIGASFAVIETEPRGISNVEANNSDRSGGDICDSGQVCESFDLVHLKEEWGRKENLAEMELGNRENEYEAKFDITVVNLADEVTEVKRIQEGNFNEGKVGAVDDGSGEYVMEGRTTNSLNKGLILNLDETLIASGEEKQIVQLDEDTDYDDNDRGNTMWVPASEDCLDESRQSEPTERRSRELEKLSVTQKIHGESTEASPLEGSENEDKIESRGGHKTNALIYTSGGDSVSEDFSKYHNNEDDRPRLSARRDDAAKIPIVDDCELFLNTPTLDNNTLTCPNFTTSESLERKSKTTLPFEDTPGEADAASLREKNFPQMVSIAHDIGLRICEDSHRDDSDQDVTGDQEDGEHVITSHFTGSVYCIGEEQVLTEVIVKEIAGQDDSTVSASGSSRTKGSGSDSVVAEGTVSGVDMTGARESHSDHTSCSDKADQTAKAKDGSAKPRGRERERSKRKRVAERDEREERGTSPAGKQKSLKNAVGDVQAEAEDSVEAAAEDTLPVSVKKTQAQDLAGRESRGIRAASSGDVRDDAVKSTCGLESQTVTSLDDPPSEVFEPAGLWDQEQVWEDSDSGGRPHTPPKGAPASRFGKRTQLHRQKPGSPQEQTSLSPDTEKNAAQPETLGLGDSAFVSLEKSTGLCENLGWISLDGAIATGQDESYNNPGDANAKLECCDSQPVAGAVATNDSLAHSEEQAANENETSAFTHVENEACELLEGETPGQIEEATLGHVEGRSTMCTENTYLHQTEDQLIGHPYGTVQITSDLEQVHSAGQGSVRAEAGWSVALSDVEGTITENTDIHVSCDMSNTIEKENLDSAEKTTMHLSEADSLDQGQNKPDAEMTKIDSSRPWPCQDESPSLHALGENLTSQGVDGAACCHESHHDSRSNASTGVSTLARSSQASSLSTSSSGSEGPADTAAGGRGSMPGRNRASSNFDRYFPPICTGPDCFKLPRAALKSGDNTQVKNKEVPCLPDTLEPFFTVPSTEGFEPDAAFYPLETVEDNSSRKDSANVMNLALGSNNPDLSNDLGSTNGYIGLENIEVKIKEPDDEFNASQHTYNMTEALNTSSYDAKTCKEPTRIEESHEEERAGEVKSKERNLATVAEELKIEGSHANDIFEHVMTGEPYDIGEVSKDINSEEALANTDIHEPRTEDLPAVVALEEVMAEIIYAGGVIQETPTEKSRDGAFEEYGTQDGLAGEACSETKTVEVISGEAFEEQKTEEAFAGNAFEKQKTGEIFTGNAIEEQFSEEILNAGTFQELKPKEVLSSGAFEEQNRGKILFYEAIEELKTEKKHAGRAFEELDIERLPASEVFEELKLENSNESEAFEELKAENSQAGEIFEDLNAEESYENGACETFRTAKNPPPDKISKTEKPQIAEAFQCMHKVDKHKDLQLLNEPSNLEPEKATEKKGEWESVKAVNLSEGLHIPHIDVAGTELEKALVSALAEAAQDTSLSDYRLSQDGLPSVLAGETHKVCTSPLLETSGHDSGVSEERISGTELEVHGEVSQDVVKDDQTVTTLLSTPNENVCVDEKELCNDSNRQEELPETLIQVPVPMSISNSEHEEVKTARNEHEIKESDHQLHDEAYKKSPHESKIINISMEENLMILDKCKLESAEGSQEDQGPLQAMASVQKMDISPEEAEFKHLEQVNYLENEIYTRYTSARDFIQSGYMEDGLCEWRYENVRCDCPEGGESQTGMDCTVMTFIPNVTPIISPLIPRRPHTPIAGDGDWGEKEEADPRTKPSFPGSAGEVEHNGEDLVETENIGRTRIETNSTTCAHGQKLPFENDRVLLTEECNNVLQSSTFYDLGSERNEEKVQSIERVAQFLPETSIVTPEEQPRPGESDKSKTMGNDTDSGTPSELEFPHVAVESTREQKLSETEESAGEVGLGDSRGKESAVVAAQGDAKVMETGNLPEIANEADTCTPQHQAAWAEQVIGEVTNFFDDGRPKLSEDQTGIQAAAPPAELALLNEPGANIGEAPAVSDTDVEPLDGQTDIPESEESVTESTEPCLKEAEKTSVSRSKDGGQRVKRSKKALKLQAPQNAEGMPAAATEGQVKKISVVNIELFPDDVPCVYYPDKEAVVNASGQPDKKMSQEGTAGGRGSRKRRTRLWRRLKTILHPRRLMKRDRRSEIEQRASENKSLLGGASSVTSHPHSILHLRQPAKSDDALDVSREKEKPGSVSLHAPSENWAGAHHKVKVRSPGQWRHLKKFRVLRYGAERRGARLPATMRQVVSKSNYVREAEGDSSTGGRRRAGKAGDPGERQLSPDLLLLDHACPPGEQSELATRSTPEVTQVLSQDQDITDHHINPEEPTVRLLLKPAPVVDKPSARDGRDSAEQADKAAKERHSKNLKKRQTKTGTEPGVPSPSGQSRPAKEAPKAAGPGDHKETVNKGRGLHSQVREDGGKVVSRALQQSCCKGETGAGAQHDKDPARPRLVAASKDGAAAAPNYHHEGAGKNCPPAQVNVTPAAMSSEGSAASKSCRLM